MVHPADLTRALLLVAFAVLCLTNRYAQAATEWVCRNATYVRTLDRLMLIEQSDASADALRIRSIPCAPSSAPLSDCSFETSLPGALLAPTSPWCADRLPLINVDLRNMTRPLPLLTGAGTSSNIQLWLTPDARLRFERRSDGALLAEELVPHRFSPVSLLGQAAGAIHEALNFTFAATTGERLYGLGQHQLAQCSNDGATQRSVCTRGVLDLKGADHTVCDKSGTECTGDHTDNCTKRQPCRLSKHQRDGLSNLHGENMEITIPLVHSSRGYSYLMNVPAMGEVQLNANGSSWVFNTALQLDLWFVAAPSGAVGSDVWNQRMSGYVNATGRSPVWPEWASGFWQSKNRYRNQSEILDVAKRYIALGLPLTVIAIDYYSWGQDAPGDDDFGDRACWPDPRTMVDELHALGVEPLLSAYFNYVRPGPVNMSGRPGIVNPIVPPSVNWLPAVAADALASNASVSSGPRHPAINGFDNPRTAVYDVFASDSRKFMMDAAVRHYTHQFGIKSWWLDCDEPCGEYTSQERVWYNHGQWPAEAVGAAYPGYLDQAVWEAMQREGKQDDFVMLGRAAWAGSHRWGGGLWSGDIHSHWAVLSQQFTAGLNAAMSGVVYWATDIGGYASHDTADPDWRELVVRWFQWSALCPIYRLHGHTSGPCEPGSGPNSTVLADTCSGGKFSQPPASGVVCDRSNEIWSFGKEAYDAIVQTMQLRQRLRPYIREQWREASRSGTPPIRPLFWEFPDDERASLITDQMMSGPRYLVAPQFARLNETGTSRDVYLPVLPEGEIWIDEWTNATHVGGQLLSVRTPLDRFGLFRRSQS